jgi:Ca2+-binding RTX toxin-like protein
MAAAAITAPSAGNAILSGTAASDNFVFNAHFGNDIVTGFQPGSDVIDINHTLFASIADLLAHTADNAGGSAVVTIGTDQSITFDSVSKMLLQQHASDFHLG